MALGTLIGNWPLLKTPKESDQIFKDSHRTHNCKSKERYQKDQQRVNYEPHSSNSGSGFDLSRGRFISRS